MESGKSSKIKVESGVDKFPETHPHLIYSGVPGFAGVFRGCVLLCRVCQSSQWPITACNVVAKGNISLTVDAILLAGFLVA